MTVCTNVLGDPKSTSTATFLRGNLEVLGDRDVNGLFEQYSQRTAISMSAHAQIIVVL